MAKDPPLKAIAEAILMMAEVIATNGSAAKLVVATAEVLREPDGARTATKLLFELITARDGLEEARRLFAETCGDNTTRDKRLSNFFETHARDGTTVEQIAAYLMSLQGSRIRKWLGLNVIDAASLRKRLNRLADKTRKNVP